MKSRHSGPLSRRLGRAVQELLPRQMRNAWRELTGEGGGETFKGAAVNRLLQDWIAGNQSPDDEIRGSFRRLRARCRDLAKNDPYFKQLLRLLVTNVLGPKGVGLQAAVRTSAGEPDKASNRSIETGWKRWSSRPVTVDGRLNMTFLSHLLLTTSARDGEVFVRKVLGFKGNKFLYALQPIEADLIDETFNRPAGKNRNEIRMGIEIDELGRRVAYHVWDRPESSTNARPRQRYIVPEHEMIHLMRPERIGQTRGTTWFDSILVAIKMLGGYEEAEMVAARIAAAKMGFLVNEGGDIPGGWGGADGETGSASDGSPAPISMDANPGSMEQLPPGWKFMGWDPQHPVQAFAAFVKQILRKIATGFGASYNAMANDLEGVNYSSMRSGLLIEREHWRVIQEWWVADFLVPVYEGWLDMALMSGQLSLGSLDSSRYLDANWRPRGWPWVDPMKDAQASQLLIKLGLDSRTDILSEQGKDFEEVIEKLAAEKQLAAAAGVDIDGVTVLTVEKDPEDEADPEDEKAGKKHLAAISLTR